jgi:hypothetical protein
MTAGQAVTRSGCAPPPVFLPQAVVEAFGAAPCRAAPPSPTGEQGPIRSVPDASRNGSGKIKKEPNQERNEHTAFMAGLPFRQLTRTSAAG